MLGYMAKVKVAGQRETLNRGQLGLARCTQCNPRALTRREGVGKRKELWTERTQGDAPWREEGGGSHEPRNSGACKLALPGL